MKTCNVCFAEKHLDQFYPSKTNRDGFMNLCKSCDSERKRRYREKNKERLSREKHEYYVANKDIIVQRNSNWYIKNRDRSIRSSAQWRKDNPERYREQQRKWKQANVQHKRELEHRRRARKQENGVYKITDKDMRYLSGPCSYCGSTEDNTMDHVIPISRGGTHGIGNLVPACLPCNNSKLDKTFSEWKYGKSRPYRAA